MSGFRIQGEARRTCGANGQWTPVAPTCVPGKGDLSEPSGILLGFYDGYFIALREMIDTI